ncbi:MAG: formate dehydrogenase subunit gamma [Gammaproteobacteria bacterium]
MKVQYPAFSKGGVLISNEVTATDSQASAAREIALAYSERPGPLLLILHAIQEAFGYVPSAAVAPVAEVLSLSRAEVHGVISFYHLFRTEPAGDRTLYVCRAEACQSMGARELEAHAKKRLGIDYHETTADGRISLEPIYCLGNCACSPAVMIDTDVHGRVDAARLDELLAEN